MFSDWVKWLWIGLILLLIGQRFLHFSPYIEDPHSWRQSDTAHYIWDFYQNGIDLLHPSVCWMGTEDTVILEFPLPEAVAAIGYHIFGAKHAVARAIFLLFFLGGAYYFWLLLKHILEEETATLATVIYLCIPLGLYYSRSIHVDFSAMFFMLAGLYYAHKDILSSSWKYWFLSTALFIIGFLIKAPYGFFLFLPLVWYAYQQGRVKRVMKTVGVFVLPVLAFLLWRSHVNSVNAAAPDWEFIPNYLKMIQMWEWYFGTWAQRMDPYPWTNLAERFIAYLSSWPGLALILSGILFTQKEQQKSYWLLWLAGVLGYVFIFFNLNYFHDYYQIPFLPILSVLMALGLLGLSKRVPTQVRDGFMLGVLLLLVGRNVYYAETNYYQLDEKAILSGEYVQAHTETEQQVITTAAYMDCRNPNWLYRARRTGWSIAPDLMTEEILLRLQQEGAVVWAVMDEHLLKEEVKPLLEKYQQISDTLDMESRPGIRILYLNNLNP